MVRVAPGATHLFAQRGNFGVMGSGVFRPNRIAGPKTAGFRDAALFITKLPKAERDTEEWQAAMKALLLVAEHDGPPMFARIGIMLRILGFLGELEKRRRLTHLDSQSPIAAETVR